MKIAVTTIGDRDVAYKGIVALSSMKENNPNFDYFIIEIDTLSRTNSYFRLLEKYGINYIKADNKMLEYIDSFDFYQYYPSAVFLKHFLPVYFNYFNYDYLIITDYDILNIRTWDLDEIIPSDETMANFQFGNIKAYIKPEQLNNICKIINSDTNILAESFIPNVGFTIYNIKKYCQSCLYKEVPELFNTLKQEWFSHVLDEICMALFQSKFRIKVKCLPVSYNFSSFWGKCPDGTLPPNYIKNIHFNYPVKLWNLPASLEKRHIPQTAYASFRQHINFLIDYANYIQGYEFAERIIPKNIKDIILQATVDKFCN